MSAIEVAVMAEQCTGRGAHGVVCAAAPLAAQAGAAVLRAGGNAFDAAVVAGLAETVLLPSKCGLGGDLVAMVRHVGANEPTALLAIGGAPAALAEAASAGPWSDTGPISVGPPTAPAGYLAVAELGRLPLDRLAAPAIELATSGFPWAAVSCRLTEASIELLRRWNPHGTAFLPGGEPIPAGAIVRLPGLAEALRSFAKLGPAFLEGPVGRAIVATVAAHGGVLTSDDVVSGHAEWVACASTQVRGRTLWTTPAPTHGASLLAAMVQLHPGDGLVEQYRAVLTAARTRRAELAEPAGDDRSSTSIVSAADRDGNCVVMVHSNSFPRFGSGLVVGEYDLVLNNRAGRGFTAEPGHPNFPHAGRRPATTLHAWALSDDHGVAAHLGGTPGGDNQITWNAQLLHALLDGVDRPGELVAGPRWEVLTDDGIRFEAGFAEDEVDAIAAAAPRTVNVGRWGLACAQQVIAVPRHGEAIVGAADPRTVGSALGV